MGNAITSEYEAELLDKDEKLAQQNLTLTAAKLKLQSTTGDLEELQSAHAKLRHAYSQLQRDAMTLAVRSTERAAILGNGTLADTIKDSLEQLPSSDTRKKRRKRKTGWRRSSVASSVVSSVGAGGGGGYEDDEDDELGAYSFSRAFNMIASKIAGGGPSSSSSSSSSSVPSSSSADGPTVDDILSSIRLRRADANAPRTQSQTFSSLVRKNVNMSALQYIQLQVGYACAVERTHYHAAMGRNEIAWERRRDHDRDTYATQFSTV